MGIKKENLCWEDHLTIWWGDMKSKIQMLSIQGYGVGMDCFFEYYQYFMRDRALWYLHFNYLKIVWEVFYPGEMATE